jgi:hypothetical protein
MDLQPALVRLSAALAPVERALTTGSIPSAVAAFREPALQQARQAIVQELSRQSTQSELIATSHALLRQHQLLSQQSDLGPTELQQLGVMSALALVLSAEALRNAVTDEQRFLHAVTQVGPWLSRAADCEVAAALPRVSAEAQSLIQLSTHLIGRRP